MLAVVLASIIAMLWTVAFKFLDGDSQAAMIGAAGGFTAGAAAVIGAWQGATWSSGLEQLRRDRENRLVAYVRLLGLVVDFDRCCLNIRKSQDIKDGLPKLAEKYKEAMTAEQLTYHNEREILADEELVTAQQAAREIQSPLTAAFLTLELIARSDVRKAASSLEKALTGQGLCETDSTSRHEAREALVAAIRTEMKHAD